MNITRTERPDITGLGCARVNYVLSDEQVFYETPKAYEIWNKEPLHFIVRIPKRRVLWIFTDEVRKERNGETG